MISTFKLNTPIVFNEWEIDLIEVPAPKMNKKVDDGFEHFEIVCDITFDEIKNRYHKFRFDESGLAKDFNHELEIPFDEFAVKFHQVSLESVINLEANEKVFHALKSSNILKCLKEFYPFLVAGTFPLDINVEKSDLDILLSSEDLSLVKNIILENFKNFLIFKCNQSLVQNEQALITSFSYHGISIEIFCQQIPSVLQKGYLHFLIEERLLKLGGLEFKQKVKAARIHGLKTEPAFAKVLDLKGDSFEELLILQKKNNQELKALIKASKH